MIPPEIAAKIRLLEEKYAALGQDLPSYLDGLYYANYITYWDYIQLDILLQLQKPRTPFPDENIFITYHQITELYFKLILHSLEQVCLQEEKKVETFQVQLTRINNYLRQLIASFEIMVEGMDKTQFLRFRMALLPASGFQSAQFRMIELTATDLINLVEEEKRSRILTDELENILENIYWRSGATELATGQKTLTLQQFEKKYMQQFLQLARQYQHCNLRRSYQLLPAGAQNTMIPLLKEFDLNMNVRWPLMHYRAVVRYLHKSPEDIAATGGTNWQQYLPPKNKRITFFPELWSEAEIADWGKSF